MKPTFCHKHANNKSDFWCDICEVTLCQQCAIEGMKSSAHKDHTIKSIEHIIQVFENNVKELQVEAQEMHKKSADKLDELKKNLISSRDKLQQWTKERLDNITNDAIKWHSEANSTIDTVFKESVKKIDAAKKKIDLQKFDMQIMEAVKMKNEGLIRDVKHLLAKVAANTGEFKRSSSWPPSQWSVSHGSLSDQYNLDMGQLTPPELNLPNLDRFLCLHKPVIKMLAVSQVKPAFPSTVGLALNEAVGCNGKMLQKFMVMDNPPSKIVEKNLPENVEFNWWKYILLHGYTLIRAHDSGPTYILDDDLDVTKIIQESHGRIVDAFSTHWVMFLHRGELKIIDVAKGQVLKTVPPPEASTWGGYICASKHPETDAMAVVDYDNKKLVIYDRRSCKLYIECPLAFQPLYRQAVTCSHEHVYVASLDSVHIYSWQGVLMDSMDRENLSMKDGQSVRGIAANGDKFMVAIGPKSSILTLYRAEKTDTFHSYRIGY